VGATSLDRAHNLYHVLALLIGGGLILGLFLHRILGFFRDSLDFLLGILDLLLGFTTKVSRTSPITSCSWLVCGPQDDLSW
jgi:hypothetical protein